MANVLDVLIDAAALIKDYPIDLVLVGAGPERDNLMARAKSLEVTNLSFLNSVPKAAIPSWLEQMDCLYLGLQHSPLYAFGVSPNKLFDYMMSARPIVYAISAGNDSVQDAGCGVSVRAEDPRAVADGILKLYRASLDDRLAMGRRGRDYILAKHTYPQLAARFLDALSQVPS